MSFTKFPTVADLHEAISAIDSELDTARMWAANQASRCVALKPPLTVGGLLNYPEITAPCQPAEVDINAPGPWAEAQTRIRTFPAIYWLHRQPAFHALARHLKLQSARSKGPFAAPDAELRLTQGVLLSLLTFRSYKDRRVSPDSMGTADWDEAVRAVMTLARLQREKGLDLSAAIWGTRALQALPPFWSRETVRRLVEAKAAAPKPHPDGTQLERKVMKQFSVFLHRVFGRAPLPLVQAFGVIIQYTPGTVKRSLPLWIAEADSLPIA